MQKLSNAAYDKLKFVTQILLPALGSLYFALAGIWGLPSADEVVGTIVALDTFLGVVLHISTADYNASDDRFSGTVHVGEENEDGMQDFHLTLPLNAGEVASKKELVLKVKKS